MNYFKKRANKYNAYKSSCQLNHKHDSGAEARYCDYLSLLKKSKEIQDFSCQVNLDLKVNDKHICNHRVDFEVINKEGKKEYHEVKGMEMDLWLFKRRLFQAISDIPYITVKEKKGRFSFN